MLANIPITLLLERRNRLRCLGCLAALITATALFAGDGPKADVPLARCSVQSIPSAPNAMRNAVALPGQFAPADGVAAHYRLGRDGDWEVPSEVDREDPHVRLLLATPGGPLIVELVIYVDGRSFRTTREAWIDEALAPIDLANASEETPSDGATSGENSDTDDVSASVYERSEARERLRQYVNRSQIPVERDEARWLLAEWVPGPALLQLRHDFAADRATLAPLWALLDADGDQHLSKVEMVDLTKRLRSRDANEDDWVSLQELSAGHSPFVRNWTPLSLGTILWESTDWNQLHRQLVDLYGPDSDRPASSLLSRLLQELDVADLSSLSVKDVKRLTDISPDIVARVDLSTVAADGVEAGVAVTHLSEPLQSRPNALQAAEQVITLQSAGCAIELSAGQGAGANWNAQVAIGTVMDGYPLLRLIDADADRRLSLREIEALTGILAGLDANGDGELEPLEVPTPIRLTVTLGPHAHDVLNTPSAASLIERPTMAPAPEWFASMDENRDSDLTPAEFLGTREQFKGLDQDGNGRVSAHEAAEATSLNP